MEKLKTLLDDLFALETFNHGVLSGLKGQSSYQKVDIKPLIIKNKLTYQFAYYQKDKVFHRNLVKDESKDEILRLLETTYRQGLIKSNQEEYQVFVNADQTVKILTNKSEFTNKQLEHNLKKKYLLSENEPLYYLIELGIMTQNGQIVKAKYDKFKQINRFLELIDDIVNQFNNQKLIKIIDFGCGKSYLTFAIHDYLTRVKNYEVDITGLDLKKDVIDDCNLLVNKYNLKGLKFLQGDIGKFEYFDQVDLVVSLHACNTATDLALYKAIKWNAKVIMAVPCCHHELYQQIKSQTLEGLIEHGIIKERMSALITDVVRTNLLQLVGYKTQIIEFIDLAHTPKNLLIRAYRTTDNRNKDKSKEKLASIKQEFNCELTLEKLLKAENLI